MEENRVRVDGRVGANNGNGIEASILTLPRSLGGFRSWRASRCGSGWRRLGFLSPRRAGRGGLRPAGEEAAGNDACGRGKGQIRQTRRRRQAEAHTTAGAREEAVGC